MQAVGRAATLLSLVLAGTVVLAAYLLWPSRPPIDDRPLAELASAVGSTLPFEARLTGGFAPSQGPTVLRSEGAASSRLSPDTRIAIAQIEKRAAADPTADSLAALGVAYLVQGDIDRSISTLQDAASMSASAAPLSDVSAAYLAKAERQPARRIEYFARALEAASQSVKRAPTDEARFNRALAIDGLTPFVGETQPWTEYLTAERDPRWLEVAKKHVADDGPVDDVRERWARRQGELRERLAKLDRAFAEETVRMFPEASIEFFEQELLAGWAKATIAKDAAATRATLAQAGLLSEVIEGVTGDRMPAAEVASIRSGGIELAIAHVAYADGIRRYDADDHANAQRSLERALDGFSRVGSPYEEWASVQLATISYQQVNLNDAQRRLATIEPVATAREYRTLLGRTLRLRGLVHTRQWRLTDALDSFRRAASHFEQAGQRENAVGVYSNLADTLRTLGEQQESWINIGKTLEGLARIRKTAPRYLFLYNASLFASSQDLLEAALLFQNATVREASTAVPGMLVDALTQRAVVHHRRGDHSSARADLGTAQQRLREVPDGGLKRYLKAEIDVLSGRLDQSTANTAALAGLKDAITWFSSADPNRVPRLYLDLARAHGARRSPTEVEQALSLGIERLESQQAGLGDQAFRISYFDESWDLYQEMIAVQIGTRNDPEKAFEYAERARARSLLASAGGPATLRPVSQIAALLPRSTVLVYYLTLPERLLIWYVDSSGARLIERDIREHELNRLVAQHRESIIERRAPRQSSDRLYELLLAPVRSTLSAADTLVFAPDGHLQQVPFGTLRDPATGRYLVEDHAVMVTPSASFFVTRRDRPPRSRLRSALLIGNPSAASAGLPGAEAEVREAAEVYSRPVVLTGDAATKERFVKAAPENDVVHFGGHAYVNPEYPLLSRLAFTAGGSAESESLFAHEISRLQFTRTQLVVLAACSTAVGSISRGEGVVSVARPFLLAGVPTVVASQWDVDDRATQQLFREFHRRLAQTQDPVGALRAAQLTLLESENAFLASPASWGAFVALGTIAR